MPNILNVTIADNFNLEASNLFVGSSVANIL